MDSDTISKYEAMQLTKYDGKYDAMQLTIDADLSKVMQLGQLYEAWLASTNCAGLRTVERLIKFGMDTTEVLNGEVAVCDAEGNVINAQTRTDGVYLCYSGFVAPSSGIA